ncbi:cytidylyltransferase domain-containing protein [Paenibacillus qinlingensis]|uniref:acylneuraminate cytidylyltransferase family protein n=1 Tax=Paenibacillus qinlingensis TaxID=1837343 RepID=UPI0015674192|nr:acylneuraminate cytidylyltransferase family protein [Paenibacillus qinlingensis]NQX61916.1 acylneuraminate cytidylyltransferase family protein [Paenibacillus qinlingensis]
MINNHKILAIIPARGGSKGIHRKNLRAIAGKPLIAWTIEEARQSKYIDRIVVSTEDEEIKQVSTLFGSEVLDRPEELSQDDTPGIEPVLHALDVINGYDYVVLLQPTSILRKIDDIDGGIEHCINNNFYSCVSVCEPDKSPYWMYNFNESGRLTPIIDMKSIARRQDLPKSYVLNGALYVAKVEWLKEHKSFLRSETAGYLMTKERSIDIDTEMDLLIAEYVINFARIGNSNLLK